MGMNVVLKAIRIRKHKADLSALTTTDGDSTSRSNAGVRGETRI